MGGLSWRTVTRQGREGELPATGTRLHFREGRGILLEDNRESKMQFPISKRRREGKNGRGGKGGGGKLLGHRATALARDTTTGEPGRRAKLTAETTQKGAGQKQRKNLGKAGENSSNASRETGRRKKKKTSAKEIGGVEKWSRGGLKMERRVRQH